MAGELLLDTSGLVSVLDRSQTRHQACAEVLSDWRGSVLTTEAVLTESTHLLGRVAGGAVACLRFVLLGGATVVPSSRDAIERAEALMRRYGDLPLDYADATLVVLGEDVGAADVVTLDSNFEVVRWRRNRAFRVHP